MQKPGEPTSGVYSHVRQSGGCAMALHTLRRAECDQYPAWAAMASQSARDPKAMISPAEAGPR